MRNKRRKSGINAGSMADIAFLLLIFFLTTTSIYDDKGITVTLPEYYDGPVGKVLERNVAVIRINSANKVLFEKREISVHQIASELREFILNPTQDSNRPRSPKEAIVSIQNDPEISYDIYMQAYSEVKAVYRQLYNEFAKERYGKDYNGLDISQKNEIKQMLPIKISEADYVIN